MSLSVETGLVAGGHAPQRGSSGASEMGAGVYAALALRFLCKTSSFLRVSLSEH